MKKDSQSKSKPYSWVSIIIVSLIVGIMLSYSLDYTFLRIFGEVTNGKITGHYEKTTSRPVPTSDIFYDFNTKDGKYYTGKISGASTHHKGFIGQKLKIIYLPSYPKNNNFYSETLTFNDYFLFSLVIIAILIIIYFISNNIKDINNFYEELIDRRKHKIIFLSTFFILSIIVLLLDFKSIYSIDFFNKKNSSEITIIINHNINPTEIANNFNQIWLCGNDSLVFYKRVTNSKIFLDIFQKDSKNVFITFDSDVNKMFFYQGEIYYTNFYGDYYDKFNLWKVGFKNSKPEKLISKRVEMFFIDDDIIYYLNGNDNRKLYKTNINTISDNKPIIEKSIEKFLIFKDKILFISRSDKNNLFLSLNNGDNIKLIYSGNVLSMLPIEDKIYICDKMNGKYNLLSCNFDGSDIQFIDDNVVTNLNYVKIEDKKFLLYSNSKGIILYDIIERSKKIIHPNGALGLQVFGNKIYFSYAILADQYRMNLDGSGIELFLKK
jgi:hypothetical protein